MNARRRTVLIVDDEVDIQSSLSFALKDEGYEVLTASSPKDALTLLGRHAVEIGLFDVWFPDGDGLELLKEVRENYPQSMCVMMSGHGNIELALKAIRMGAYDFLEKPLELEKLLVVLNNVNEALNLRDENLRLSKELLGSAELIGDTPPIKALGSDIQKVAGSAAHVLILGENGAGKELVARLIHKGSPRVRAPFVTINCAHLAEDRLEVELFGTDGPAGRQTGRLEQAGEGTVFFDEILELSLSAQAKLLRVLEDRSFRRVGGQQTIRMEARVLAASNRDLASAVKEGRLREDLYFRLKVVSLRVPSLKERADDVRPLATYFLERLAKDYARPSPQVSPELARWMQQYDWPGNVRELRNLLERMLILSPDRHQLGISDLPEELQSIEAHDQSGAAIDWIRDPQGELRTLRAQFERMIIDQRLAKNQGNVTKTAESLGIKRAHLHRKIKQYGLGSN